MDEHRSYAYRYLLYWAMLDIRPIAAISHRVRWFNPFSWRPRIRRVCALGELAEWLHNMAAFSALNFVGFDELRFWEEFRCLRSKYPEFQYYRSLFQSALSESETGHWPTVEEQMNRDA